MIRKVIRLTSKQLNELEELEKEINTNNGEITITKLIRDAVTIFLEYYKNEAIQRYSGNYKIKMEEKHD